MVDAPARCWTTSDLIPLFPSLATRCTMSSPISCTATRDLSCIPSPTLVSLLTAAAIECSMYKTTTFHRTPRIATLDPKHIRCLGRSVNENSPLLRILHNVLSVVARAQTISVIIWKIGHLHEPSPSLWEGDRNWYPLTELSGFPFISVIIDCDPKKLAAVRFVLVASRRSGNADTGISTKSPSFRRKCMSAFPDHVT